MSVTVIIALAMRWGFELHWRTVCSSSQPQVDTGIVQTLTKNPDSSPKKGQIAELTNKQQLRKPQEIGLTSITLQQNHFLQHFPSRGRRVFRDVLLHVGVRELSEL